MAQRSYLLHLIKQHCLRLLSVVSKIFEKLVNNKLFDHYDKCRLFSDFQYGFRYSWSTDDPPTVTSDKVVRALIRSGATSAVDIGLPIFKIKSIRISGRLFGLCDLFSVKDDFELFWIGSLRKNIQLMLEFLKAPFFFQHFSNCILMTFLMMLHVILLSMLIILLYSKCE